MNTNSIKAPITFWIIGSVGLIWNIMGLMAWYMDFSKTAEDIALLPTDQQALYQQYPNSLLIVYGLAVVAGVLGCLLLLMKKSAAIPVFIISLICILIQMGYSLFMTDAVEVFGIAQAITMPIMVIFIGVFLWFYAKSAKAKNWIA